MHLEFADHSQKGVERKENQDQVLVLGNAHFAMVADGMGGMAAGEVASKMVKDVFESKVSEWNSWPSTKKQETVSSLLPFAFEEANDKIINYRLANPENDGMGTTATAALFFNETLYCSSIGDSRLYVLDDKGLKQITHDHSYVQDLFDNKIIDYQEYLIHPHRNILKRAVGIKEAIKPDHFTIPVSPGNYCLICSDGLNSVVRDEQITEILTSSGSLTDIKDNLVQQALKNGSTDDISIILIKANN
ncbi:MAG: Stp1/IreP family PP2C-type Ser/Thr phosphatase [Fibrobacteria bacterium]|nr:Stp1/IreP family PP2C-type Ser/Thr phosphatase [Fibrobacteria bacterium]